ncbi:MAG: ATP-binding protein [Dehalococcoidia bacterium]|nr:MAG: ATP-binding protein [Dehalococcoidia bacterium]
MATQLIVEPAAIEELGLDPGLLTDLALKTVFFRGRLTRAELSDALKLSASVTQDLMQALTLDGLASVLGAESGTPSNYMYTLTGKGAERAEAALGRSGYVGPAPVPLREYIAHVRQQSIGDVVVTREQVLRSMRGLVLAEQTLTRIGRAASSRKSTLIYGPSGNGKTTAVRAVGAAIEGAIDIPFAVEMMGHIVHLYDPSKHQPAGDDEAGDGDLLRVRRDRRWARVRRPVIWAGGELTRHSLELVYDDNTKVYEAPLQLKANGGTLIIDDFGRQQIPAVQLLNRWIVALEGGIDHLTLHTGQTIEVPFDVLILFSTNLPPEQLADEAFLRRIRYKVEIPNPTPDDYRAIFRLECASRDLPYDDAAVTHLLDRWYGRQSREMRGCHPRDIVEAIVDAAQYEQHDPLLSIEAIDEACATYFLTPLNAPG